jgi:predicted membrane protein (TIGR00267 family)
MMDPLERLSFLLRIGRSRGIARRYFVVNGFDGALTMLGLTIGFITGGGVPISVAISACLGAAIALGASGLTSAYISESAEKRRELRHLEEALLTDLSDTDHGEASRIAPLAIAAVNGLAPLAMSLLIMLPLWLAQMGVALPLPPLQAAVTVAFVVLFLLGVFLGRISGTFWLWSGLRAVLIAAATALVIVALRH